MKLFSILLICAVVNGDLYVHYPRASNNRLNEASANRNNANRLFDSQNNNRGGYNVGDLDTEDGFDQNNPYATFKEKYAYDRAQDSVQRQYEEIYFEGEIMTVTWTNQHGTGNQKLESQIVIQYTCDNAPSLQDEDNYSAANAGPDLTPSDIKSGADATTFESMLQLGLRVELQNGGTTDTPNEADECTQASLNSAYTGNNAGAPEGRHESEEWYCNCERYKRNYGLFTADQKLQGDTSIYTRQNPGGTRRGLECPEERDYYPYWRPSPWVDIAYISSNNEEGKWCPEFIQTQSQNVAEKNLCVSGSTRYVGNLNNDDQEDEIYEAFTQEECEATEEGEWASFTWGIDAPECVKPYWTKVNHLGNRRGKTVGGGEQAAYRWEIPSSDTLDSLLCHKYSYTAQYGRDPETGATSSDTITADCYRLVLRLRYNMSSTDYDPWKTFAESNDNPGEGVVSPVQQNPTVDVGVMAAGLRLAINTAQLGRTFQDRSHTFLVCDRKTANAEIDANTDILAFNVQGKRGNIVQTFPATEYFFMPRQFAIGPGQCFHAQWTGSNTHNNGNPAGDGQAGDAGEGRGGSDRHNFLQMLKMQDGYPLTRDQFSEMDFLQYFDCEWPLTPDVTVSTEDAAIILGTSGFYKSRAYAESIINNNNEDDALVDELFNNAQASFKQGLMCCLKTTGLPESGTEFAFLCTRNNNFSNRAQKALIMIVDDAVDWLDEDADYNADYMLP